MRPSKSVTLNNDVHKVLELFTRKFELNSEPDTQTKPVEIRVNSEDLAQFDIEYYSFGEALYQMEKYAPTLHFPLIEDFDDYNARVQASDVLPLPLTYIKLPANFLKIAEKLKRHFPLSTDQTQTVSEIEINITYYSDLGRLVFNDDEENAVTVEGKQKNTADCLIERGKNKKVSWDEIHDSFGEIAAEDNEANKRSVRTAVTKINIRTRPLVEKNKDLIDYKNNEYWLQYKVAKGR